MDDLIAFLRARLDEDEQVARAAQGDDLFNGTGIVVMQTHGGGSRSITLPSHVAGFAARWDPARMLAEVEANRQILDLAEATLAGDARDVRDEHGMFFSNPIARRRIRDVLRLLALPYADHPDYRQEWRP